LVIETMNRLVRNILTLALVLTFATCSEEPERILYTGPDFVFLDSKPQLSLYENQKTPLSIPVKVSLSQSSNTNVTFEVIGDNVLSGSDYQLQTASPVLISHDKFGATISILPVDNNIVQPEKRTITIRIKSTDNPALSIQVVKEVQINLLDDDCPPTVPKVSLWVGQVNIQGGSSSTEVGTAEGGSGGICGGSMVVVGKFFGSGLPESTMTIILRQSTLNSQTGTASVVRFPLFSTYEYEASGNYDEVGKSISLNYSVYDTSDNTFLLTGTHIITPK
jgi:hypothetical protein